MKREQGFSGASCPQTAAVWYTAMIRQRERTSRFVLSQNILTPKEMRWSGGGEEWWRPGPDAVPVTRCPFLHLFQCYDNNVEFFSFQDRQISDENASIHPVLCGGTHWICMSPFRNWMFRFTCKLRCPLPSRLHLLLILSITLYL